MKLYYMPGACPLVTHIVLEWIGKPYETVRLTHDQIKEPAYLALNPVGAVPTLVDGDFVLTQSVAILEFLVELNPDARLLSGNPEARAEARRWLSFCNSDVHRTFGLLFTSKQLTDGDEKAAQTLERNVAKKLREYFIILNERLKGRSWLANSRSIADPYLYVMLRWAKMKSIDLSGLDELPRFVERMESDKGVQAALKAQGLS